MSETVDMGVADLALFSPADQTTLLTTQAQLQAIVAAGPGGFDGTAAATLLGSAVNLVTLLTQVDCDGFLAP